MSTIKISITEGVERCAHCRRPIGSRWIEETVGGVTSVFCGQRAACRRASYELAGETVRTSGASTEALGAALIAADYVKWPWWGRLLPGSARDELRGRFAEAMSAEVEHYTLRKNTER